MPKKTFDNLKKEKKAKIIQGLLREFTLHNYDDASISAAVKHLKISKGSIYQYFDDKKDVFFFLIQHCSEIKSGFIREIDREDYPDFWSYFRSLYSYGFDMLLKYPQESAFLHLLTDNVNTPSLQDLFSQMKKQTLDEIEQWVKIEVEQGNFRNDLSTRELAYYLYNISSNLVDAIKTFHNIDIKENIKSSKPVYGTNGKTDFMKVVDSNIQFLKQAMNTKQQTK